MKTQDPQPASPMTVKYEVTVVDTLSIAYREAGNPENPKLVLLHGFPASSHQYRNLMPALADRFHLIAPDYPGFGNSDMPDPANFAYTFDRIAEITGKFLKQKGFDRYGLFVQDYGGPVGFRIVTSNPAALQWLIIQNTNAYEVGFTEAWAGLRNSLWKNRTPETEKGVAGLLEFDTIKAVYLHGHKRPEVISPDNWNMDFRYMERPNARRVQMDLFYDYRTNVGLYPKWQKFLRDHQPTTLIFWGQDDIFFTREGGEAYLKDLPSAEMHRLDSGHFAVEDCLGLIATNIGRFYDEKVMSIAQTSGARKTG
ncbi:MAG TPA: alpha/beta hydrolase [Terriglobales bacterium]|nr:alpha/beta hydrolase [Terriglobales bacterium]